jgi:hypothetical protein
LIQGGQRGCQFGPAKSQWFELLCVAALTFQGHIVKQTKPFGRACLTPAEAGPTLTPPQNQQPTQTTSPDIDDKQVTVDLFDIRGAAPLDAASNRMANRWIKRLRDSSVALGASCNAVERVRCHARQHGFGTHAGCSAN